jgi:hypothetical protein
MTKQVDGVRPALRQLWRGHLRAESFMDTIMLPERASSATMFDTEQNPCPVCKTAMLKTRQEA